MEQNENMTSVVIEQEGENKKRSALAVILALAVVVILGIGTTFAYLSYTGNQTPNRFTTDSGISCDLLEPAWTNAIATAYPGVASDGSSIPLAANNTAKNSVIAKDPYVVNTGSVGNDTGSGVNEFVGIRLTFQKWVAKTATGAEGEHSETGQYVTMTDDEVAALMKVYGFTSDKIVSEETETPGAGESKPSAVSAGLKLGAGWSQCTLDGVATTSGKSTNGSMYFTYANQIKSIGTKVTEATDATVCAAQDTVETASTTPGNATTTNLFKNVVHVADKSSDDYKNFLSYLYTGSVAVKDLTPALEQNTTDPGWRVLVSCAATDATYSTIKDVKSIAPTTYEEDGTTVKVAEDSMAAAIRKEINGKHAKIMENGSSATITGLSTTHGSGFRGDVSIPEASWNY